MRSGSVDGFRDPPRDFSLSLRLRTTLIATAAQYGALALGCSLGFSRLLPPEPMGVLAGLAFFAETLRYGISPRLRRAYPSTTWLCLGLLVYVGWFLCGGSDLDPRDGLDFVVEVHLLLPFLLAIGPLARSKAWWGVAGAVAFYAAAVSILIVNGLSWGGFGFFHGRVVY